MLRNRKAFHLQTIMELIKFARAISAFHEDRIILFRWKALKPKSGNVHLMWQDKWRQVAGARFSITWTNACHWRTAPPCVLFFLLMASVMASYLWLLSSAGAPLCKAHSMPLMSMCAPARAADDHAKFVVVALCSIRYYMIKSSDYMVPLKNKTCFTCFSLVSRSSNLNVP